MPPFPDFLPPSSGPDAAPNADAPDSEAFARILEASGDAVLVIDSEWRYAYFNDLAEQLHGRKREEMVGRKVAEVFPEVLETHFWKVYQRARREKALLTAQEYFAPLGKWFDIRAIPHGDDLYIHFRDISTQKQNEERERNLLTDIFMRAPSFMSAMRGPDHVLIMANPPYHRLVGEHRHIIGKRIAEALPEIVDQGLIELLNRVYQTGEPYVGRDVPVMLRAAAANDAPPREHILNFTFQPLFGDRDEVTGVLVHGIDLTEHKQRERELRAATEALRITEERLRLATESANLGTWDFNLVAGDLYWDAQCRKFFGYPPDKPIDFPTCLSLIHPDDRPEVEAAVTNAMSPRSSGDYAVEFRAVGETDGVVRWLRVEGSAFFDETRTRATRLVGILQDISERKRIEAELREARIRLEAALSAGEIATWTWDVVQNRVAADPNLAQLFSIDPARSANGAIDIYVEAIHPDDRERVVTAILAALESGDRFEQEYRVVLPGGETRWLVARGTVQRDEDGRPVSLPGVAVDITRLKEAEARTRRSEDQFRALFDSMAQGVLYRDAVTHRIVQANPAAERILGVTLAQMQERTLDDAAWQALREDSTPMPLEEMASWRALTTRQPIRGLIQGIYNPRLGQKRWLRVDAAVEFRPGESEPYRVYSLFEDITEQRALEAERERLYDEAREHADRERLLADATQLLNASLDYRETLTNVARLMVPRFADWCAVDILDEVGALQRVAVEHVDPEKAAWGWELHRRYPTRLDSERGVAGVLRTGKPSLASEINDEMLAASITDPEQLHIIREIGLTSVMLVPLAVRGSVFGVLSLIGTRESGRRYRQEDLTFAVEVGRRAALAMENARLFEATQAAEARQRHIAETLQESMLLGPPAGGAFPGLEVDTHYEAAWDEALIGGDYGDAFRVDEKRVALLVGDCTGKGLNAARFVAECEFMARAFLRENPDPADALRRLNTVLVNGQRWDDRPDGALTTLVIAVIDIESGETLVAAGGAEPPLLARAASGEAHEIEVQGALLGMDPDADFAPTRVRLAPGDVLALSTDGTTEARNRETRRFFGYEGLTQTVRELVLPAASLNGTAEAIVARAKQFAGGALSDDACVLAARFTGSGVPVSPAAASARRS